MKTLLYTLIFSFASTICFAQNHSLMFNGSDGQLELCNSESFNIGEEFTIEAWIYASEWRAEAWQGSIVTKDMQGPDSGFAFRAGKNGTLSFVVGTNAWPEVQSDPFMNANQWYHVAAVKQEDRMQLFINGNLVSTGLLSNAPAHNNQTVIIGESSGFPGRQWNGFIDEVRIWDIARTEQELSDNQTETFSGNEAGLVAYLPMNDGSGLSAANLADDSCEGTFSGMTESAWSEGYSIPAKDVGVVNVTAPDVISMFTKPVKIRAELQNFGSESISNIPVGVTINGLPSFTETFDISLQPGEIKTVVFDRIVDLTDNNTNLISLATEHPDDSNNLNNETSYRYRKPQNGSTINILNEERFNFAGDGQTKFTNVNLPEDNEEFGSLLLHISLECPSSGCDPWDQPARISVETGSGSFEIARFITPYGQGCGPWTIDVTDFKSILKGGVTFKSFVQVWGPSGWLVNLDLEYTAGDSPIYNKLTTLWESDNWVYGDPGISYDLPEQTIPVDENTQSNHVRMTITGHGQGNTDNAAEFSNRTHSYVGNGEIIDVQNLWRNDCAQNECANQAGTWTLSRAGWCPGQAVEPYILNTTSIANPGDDFSIDYRLQEYTNLLNTGYNSGGHTEPHYKIFSYFIESSENRFSAFTNLRAKQVIIQTNGDVNNPVINSLDFEILNTGSEDISNPRVAYYVNDEFVFEETASTTIAAGQLYTHSFSQVSGFDFTDDNLVYAVIYADGDENINDDATKSSINEDLVDVVDLEETSLSIVPNPSSGIVNYSLSDTFINGKLQVIDILGRTVQQASINNVNGSLNIKEKGVYLIQFSTPKGSQRSEKIVIE